MKVSYYKNHTIKISLRSFFYLSVLVKKTAILTVYLHLIDNQYSTQFSSLKIPMETIINNLCKIETDKLTLS